MVDIQCPLLPAKIRRLKNRGQRTRKSSKSAADHTEMHHYDIKPCEVEDLRMLPKKVCTKIRMFLNLLMTLLVFKKEERKSDVSSTIITHEVPETRTRLDIPGFQLDTKLNVYVKVHETENTDIKEVDSDNIFQEWAGRSINRTHITVLPQEGKEKKGPEHDKYITCNAEIHTQQDSSEQRLAIEIPQMCKDCFEGTELLEVHKTHEKKPSEQEEGTPQKSTTQSLMKLLLQKKFVRIKPQHVQVFIVMRSHPSKLDDIPWAWLYMERWRLQTFAKYPHRTAKSALQLAAEGFAYIGSGKGSDDHVICFFCCVTKRDWQTEDIIPEVHRAISPTCCMVMKVNCPNVSFTCPQNSKSLFSELHKSTSAAGNQPMSAENAQLEFDSAPDASQPTSQGVASEQPQPVAPQHKGNGSVRIQLATSTVMGPASQRSTSSAQNFLSTVTPYQPSNNDGPSSTVTSGNSSSRSSNPFGQASVGGSQSSQQAGTGSQRSSSITVSAPGAASTTTSASQAQSSSAWSSSTQSPISAASVPGPNSSSSSSSSSRPAAPFASAPTSSTQRSGSTTQNASTNAAASTTSAQVAPNTSTAINNPSSTETNTSQRSTGNDSGQPVRTGPTYHDLGIITERPKRFEYALRQKRLETFTNCWPRDHHLKPEDLADAGFYYAGYGDCARCFYCGGGLRNWEDNDNVWVEHARWFPKCAFMKQTKGQAFVETVQELNKSHDQISYELVVEKLGEPATAFQLDSKDQPLKRDPAVKSVIEMGFIEKDVLEAAAVLKESGTILSADTLFEKLEQDGKQRSSTNNVGVSVSVRGNSDSTKDDETMRTLKEQNNELRQQTVCKICMDKEVAVVFLPCGHLVSCSDCAVALKDCPVCRVNVKGIVRAFMS